MLKKIYKRPLSVISFFVLLFFLGILSLFKLNVALLPSMEYGVINIETVYDQATSTEVEEKITNIIEKNISAIPGLKFYKSVSYSERSVVTLVFNESKEDNYDKYYLKVREKVEALKNILPDEAHIPVVKMYDPNNLPSFVIGLKYSDIKKISREDDMPVIIRGLESIDGVNNVDVKGIPQKKIFIRINNDQLALLDIKATDILDSIKENNFDFPGGTITSGGQDINVNIRGSIKDIEKLERLIVSKQGNGKGVVYLSQIADVIEKDVEEDFAVVNGERMILLEIYTSAGTTLSSVSKDIKYFMENKNMEYIVVADYSETVGDSINEILISMLFAMFFTLIILIGFFGSVKLGLLVAIVIPFAIVINLIFMFLFKVNINMLSLSGLVISVGLIVDNSLVVIDKLQYYASIKSRDYIVKAVSSTFGPLLSSTFTTVIAFLPVIFLTGLTGEFFRQIALSVSMTLFISLFLAFLFIPSLYDYWVYGVKMKSSNRGIFQHFLKRVIVNLSVFFYRYHIVTTLFVIFISGISLYMLTQWEIEFLPESLESTFSARIDMKGMSDEQLSFEIAILNDFIKNSDLKDLDWGIGVDLDDSDINGYFSTDQERVDYTYKKLKDYFNRRGIKVDFVMNPSWNIPESFRLLLRLNIFDDELEELYTISEYLEENLKEQFVIDELIPERVIAIRPDIEKTEMLQIDIEELKNTVKVAYGDFRLTELIKADSYIGVYVEPFVKDESIHNLKVVSETGKKVFLKDFANIEIDNTYTPIYHYEGKRFVEARFPVLSNIDEEIVKISEVLSKKDIEYEFTGINNTKDKMIKNMMYALIVALILIYLILVIQYESFKKPVVILILLPFTFSCSMLVWYLSNINLNLMNMLGIIILSGITVNNSIILLSEIIKRRDFRKAVISRSRAIFITTLTTVMGAIPMLFGTTAAMRIPLALTIIGGMSISWLVNLVFLPAVNRTVR